MNHLIRQGDGVSLIRVRHANGTRETVKTVDLNHPRAKSLLSRLQQEVGFLQSLNHPHWLRVRRPEEHGRAAFADVQCSMKQYVNAMGPLPPAIAARLLWQAVLALEVLHATKRGHGCINLHTILVGTSGELIFGDMAGFAWNGGIPTPDPLPDYLAPELVDANLGRAGPSSDLYMLGYAALEMLLGGAFDGLLHTSPGSSPLAWHADREATLVNWRPTLAHVPRGLLDLIDGIIVKVPKQRRFKTATEFRTALETSGQACEKNLPAYAPPGEEIVPLRKSA
jgi:serine/threonine-protein kinase